MPSHTEVSNVPNRALSQFGLAVLVSVGAIALFAGTVAVPPWQEVQCQRRQTLYWSERTAIRSRSFAGFDSLLTPEKWSSVKTPPNSNSGELFESTEFQIFWPALVGEWLVIGAVAVTVFSSLSRRWIPPTTQLSHQSIADPVDGTNEPAAEL